MISDKKILKYILERVEDTEIRLVQALADDISRKEIAENMGISVRTVELYFFNLRKKFECKKESALITIFFRAKLIK